MADKEQDAPVPSTLSTGKRFIDMTVSEKLNWLGKVVVMLATGGFAFPNVFVE